ncbi:hypothetical protein GJ668_14595 [Allochromatium palmeri]|uniref:Uncharacterized protein n=1 Tax=Allochromatium palmeri TaxID=231048 RepID=A0A6N8EJ02_9GAMM|nr:hypothetical protein [Allochromatium palmeri]
MPALSWPAMTMDLPVTVAIESPVRYPAGPYLSLHPTFRSHPPV